MKRTVYCGGFYDGGDGKRGPLGVGLPVKESIVRKVGPDGIELEYINARQRKVPIPLKNTSVMMKLSWANAPTQAASTCAKKNFYHALRSAVA